MKLENLGYNQRIEKLRNENNLKDFDIGRIISEHKERYIVKTEKGEFEAEITGNLRFTANGREDFPAVGDWVALVIYDEYISIIHKVLPRYSMISRRSVGQSGEIQIIATNVDYAFIVQAIDRDFSINRIERYLAICNSLQIAPIIILAKIDLISKERQVQLKNSIKKRINNVPIFAISNTSKQGIDELKRAMFKGKTYCLLGSSGVGKSTLLNTIEGKQLVKTGSIGVRTNRGKHVTTHRELRILDNGGIVIDNPGMREVGIADASVGLEKTFETIIEHSKNCKFKDCTHTSEIGCAIILAVEIGDISKSTYENYLKMVKEKEHFESTLAKKKKKDKALGKMIKQSKSFRKKNKY